MLMVEIYDEFEGGKTQRMTLNQFQNAFNNDDINSAVCRIQFVDMNREEMYFQELKTIFENESIHKLNDADEIISKLKRYNNLILEKSYWTNAVNVEIGNIWTPIFLREDGCELCEEWEKCND